MKSILLVALFTGIIMVVVNEFAATQPKVIEYRYLPRDLDDYIRTAPLASTVYSAMFDERDVI